MIPDLSNIFSRYEALVIEADAIFEQVSSKYSDCVPCSKGCSDCCYAMFDLSLMEAIYLNSYFVKNFGFGRERSNILTRASDIDRQITKLKRKLYQDSKDGVPAEEIMLKVASIKMKCPLLDETDTCLLYDKRPITCRLYGIPTAISGKGHVCSKTDFKKGESYPTVHMEKIQNRLAGLSQDISTLVHSKYKELHHVYAPVSMVLLTKYDENYLGIKPAKNEE